MYTVYRGESPARLVINRSDDGGRTWSAETVVAKDVPPEAAHGAANVSVNRRGILAVSWLQRTPRPTPPLTDDACARLTCFNETYQLRFSASYDGGETFLAPITITSESSSPQPKHASRFWPGQDYMLATASVDGTFHLLWPDARRGIFQLYATAVRVE